MKNNQPDARSNGSVLVIILLLVSVLIVASGVFIYKHQQKVAAIEKERSEYVQAEKDIDSLVAQITTKFGKPDDQKKERYCGYTSNPNEFAKGDLYCSVGITVSYQVADRAGGNIDEKKISSIVDESKVFTAGNSSTIFANDASPPPITLLSQHLKSNTTSLDCSSSYTFYLDKNRTQGYPDLHPVRDAGLAVDFTCGSRPAKAAYYPIKNS